MGEFSKEAATPDLCRLILKPPFRRGGFEPGHWHSRLDIRYSARLGRPVRLDLDWIGLDWSATVDMDGLTIRHAGSELCLPWDDLPPNPEPPERAWEAARSDDCGELMAFPFAKTGAWSRLNCPAAFGGWVWIAIQYGLAEGRG